MTSNDLSAPLMLFAGAELACIVSFHAGYDSPEHVKVTPFAGRIYSAMADGTSSKIGTIQKLGCGYRSPSRLKIAVHFHCGGLSLWSHTWTH